VSLQSAFIEVDENDYIVSETSQTVSKDIYKIASADDQLSAENQKVSAVLEEQEKDKATLNEQFAVLGVSTEETITTESTQTIDSTMTAESTITVEATPTVEPTINANPDSAETSGLIAASTKAKDSLDRVKGPQVAKMAEVNEKGNKLINKIEKLNIPSEEKKRAVNKVKAVQAKAKQVINNIADAQKKAAAQKAEIEKFKADKIKAEKLAAENKVKAERLAEINQLREAAGNIRPSDEFDTATSAPVDAGEAAFFMFGAAALALAAVLAAAGFIFRFIKTVVTTVAGKMAVIKASEGASSSRRLTTSSGASINNAVLGGSNAVNAAQSLAMAVVSGGIGFAAAKFIPVAVLAGVSGLSLGLLGI
ncbi:MAG: hypothetical protein AAB221_16060, partial [Bacteroidota bacterium]